MACVTSVMQGAIDVPLGLLIACNMESVQGCVCWGGGGGLAWPSEGAWGWVGMSCTMACWSANTTQ